MYENIKLMKCEDECPLGIRFVGETMCDEKFIITRNCSDLTSFEYIVDGYGTLEINGQVLHPQKGDIFFHNSVLQCYAGGGDQHRLNPCRIKFL